MTLKMTLFQICTAIIITCNLKGEISIECVTTMMMLMSIVCCKLMKNAFIFLDQTSTMFVNCIGVVEYNHSSSGTLWSSNVSDLNVSWFVRHDTITCFRRSLEYEVDVISQLSNIYYSNNRHVLLSNNGLLKSNKLQQFLGKHNWIELFS